VTTTGNEAIPLVDGSHVEVRPMVAGDRDRMLSFARSLPDHDLLFLRRDITRPEEIDGWLSDIASGGSTTLVATDDGQIVGYASVSRSSPPWRRHVAELRVLTAPGRRGQGLGRALTNHAFLAAVDLGVEKMVAQMTPDQEVAIGVFYRLGFEQEARLVREVQDRGGRKHDLIVLSHDVSSYQEARRARDEA